MANSSTRIAYLSGPVDMCDRLTAATRQEHLLHSGAAAVGALILVFIHLLSQLIGDL